MPCPPGRLGVLGLLLVGSDVRHSVFSGARRVHSRFLVVGAGGDVLSRFLLPLPPPPPLQLLFILFSVFVFEK